jgi:hypothetical protein
MIASNRRLIGGLDDQTIRCKTACSLFPRSFVLIAFTVIFSRLMSSNRAPNGRTYNAVMTCIVAGDSANNSSLKTAFGICRVGHGDHGKD